MPDALVGEDSVGLHADYAAPIPCEVIAHIIGLPNGGAENLKVWSSDGSVMFRAVCPQLRPRRPAHNRLPEGLGGPGALGRRARLAHLQSVLERRDRRPAAQRYGDRPPAPDHGAGRGAYHPGLLAHSMHRLIVEPDTWAALEADRELIPGVRRGVAAPRLPRSPSGPPMPEGHHPGRGGDAPGRLGWRWAWPQPTGTRPNTKIPKSFRLDRPDPLNHVAFGAGAHVCPGASLARLEGVTAIETLLDRVATLTPVDGFQYPPLPANLVYSDLPAHINWRQRPASTTSRGSSGCRRLPLGRGGGGRGGGGRGGRWCR